MPAKRDAGEREPGSHRASELQGGRQPLAEQVELAGPREAERRRRGSHADGLPGQRHLLQGSDQQCHRHRERGHENDARRPHHFGVDAAQALHTQAIVLPALTAQNRPSGFHEAATGDESED